MPRARKTRAARANAEPFWKIGLCIRLSKEDDSKSIINHKHISKGENIHESV